MAGGRGGGLGGFMKMMHSATKHRLKKTEKTCGEPLEPPSGWKTAVPPRIGGPSPSEWRPGAPSKKSYEHAVAEWWWI